ncbi:MAG: roadblock/LC7 domain-containing protein [Chloroflexaceae bacterium]|nr:roadblock/LC7 domain-containing protein [Chloroflexaceae bacterium]
MANDLKSLLGYFRALKSIELAAIVAHDGLLIESNALPYVDVDAVCAVASNGVAMSESLGREISKGDSVQILLEYEEGVVLLELMNHEAMLLLVANAREELGYIRFLVALHRDELVEALEAI